MRGDATARLFSTNDARREQVNAWYTPLPDGYYDLSRRLARLLELMDAITDPALRARAEVKRDRLASELQAIVNETLGGAPCPLCEGLTLEQAAGRALRLQEAFRVCVLHDLDVLRLREVLTRRQGPPGTNEPPSPPAATSSGRSLSDWSQVIPKRGAEPG